VPDAGTTPLAAPPPVNFASDNRLQREAVVLVHDRGRFAVLVSVCTLAGVALGFTLATLSGSGAARCDHGEVRASHAPPVMVAPDHDPPDMKFWGPGAHGGVHIWKDDPHAWLGVSLEDAANGARVTEVMSGSPASQAGIQTGDVIVQVDAESIATASQMVRLVRDHDPGDALSITLERDGDEVSLDVSLSKIGGSAGVRVR
jgi:membrane-associated protease RseP (regulator of RpoE activity)